MTKLQFNPVYLYAAAGGHCGAQSDLALACRRHAESIAEENPGLADEYFSMAETFAVLACAHEQPHDYATLAGIYVARCLHSASRDPVRSLEYRDDAERLFDAVESADDSRALGIVGLALNKLADADPDDDRATVRLNRIVAALPPGEAQLLRTIARPAKSEPQVEQHR